MRHFSSHCQHLARYLFKGYYNCSCVSADFTNSSVMAYVGACSGGCETRLAVFLVVLFIVVAAESVCITPATILILKLIDKPLQSFALGILRCANLLIGMLYLHSLCSSNED